MTTQFGTASTPSTPSTPSAPRRRRDAAVVALGLLAGLLIAVFGGDVADVVRRDARPVTPVTDIVRQDFDVVASAPSDPATTTPTPAASPAEAVERFLAAEVGGNLPASFALLVGAERSAYRSPASWRASHADFFPVVAFEVTGVTGAEDRSDVITRVRYRSSIDEVIGLVPERAEVTWPVVHEDGGWLVDFDAAEITPIYPADAGVTDAVGRWVDARQKCKDAEEYSAGLVGLASLADRLCKSTGRPVLGPVASLDASDAAPFVSAFGPPALSWARTVRITSSVPLTAVVAPVGHRWLVVGVLAPR